MTDYTDLIARLLDEAQYNGPLYSEAARALEAQARRIAGYQKDADDYLIRLDELNALRDRIVELEAQNEFIMSANNELSWALRERNEALSRIAELKAALKPFADLNIVVVTRWEGDVGLYAISASDLRAARAAYLGEKDG